MKKDINFHESCYKNWKDEVKELGIEGITKKNSDLLRDYIFDMEVGQNVARKSKKGARSYGRLNVSRRKLIQIFKMLEERGIKDICKVKEKQLHEFFNDLYTGKIRRVDGKKYEFAVDFVRVFKSFYHWYMKVQRKLYVSSNEKKGAILIDICEDLDLQMPDTKFVYITKPQLEKMQKYFTEGEQLLNIFLFDTLIRFPTEALSLTAKDIYEKDGEIWVNIPSEISKTYGRTFNLLYCGDALMKYIKKKELKPDDYIFPLKNNYDVGHYNKKLKDVAVKVLGDKVSHPKAKENYSKLSGYDFRHSGAIHLRILAQKTSLELDSIRHRGGWVDFKMLNYYTQFIGLTGEIKKESLLVQEDKTKLEKELAKYKTQSNAKIKFQDERLDMLEEKLRKKIERLIDTDKDKSLGKLMGKAYKDSRKVLVNEVKK